MPFFERLFCKLLAVRLDRARYRHAHGRVEHDDRLVRIGIAEEAHAAVVSARNITLAFGDFNAGFRAKPPVGVTGPFGS